MFAWGAILGAFFLGAMGAGIAMVRYAIKIEPVAPITRHNTGFLPEVETLVRGSDRPGTNQQAELLRAAGQGPETPSEQLLRAAQGNAPDG